MSSTEKEPELCVICFNLIECTKFDPSYLARITLHGSLVPGNHESAYMNQIYGFEGEVKSKYTDLMAQFFTEVYNWLPLCHCINNKVLVMHGGLFSSDNVTLEDIRTIDRNRQPPDEGTTLSFLLQN